MIENVVYIALLSVIGFIIGFVLPVAVITITESVSKQL